MGRALSGPAASSGGVLSITAALTEFLTVVLTVLALAVPSVIQAQALSGEELYIDRLGCWNCHGMMGGGGAGPAISDTELPLRTFAAYLRLPSGEMPRVSARLASDADLATLYRWLDGIEAQSTSLRIELNPEESSVAGVGRSEVTLTVRPAEPSLDYPLPDTGALRYRFTVQTMVPWVREKAPVADHTVEFQLGGREDWSTFTTDERGEAILDADRGFGLSVAPTGGPATARLRTLLPAGRHSLVVEALDGADPSDPLVVGMGTVVLRGPEEALSSPFRPVENHFKLAEGRWWGSTSAVDIDIDGRSIWVAERCAGNGCAGSRLNPVLNFDASGQLRRRFGEGMFILPHGIHVDRDGNVWVTDSQGPDGRDPNRDGKGHAVYKFSPTGRLLHTLGTPGVRGDGTGALLNAPHDIVTAANGDIFIADGGSVGRDRDHFIQDGDGFVADGVRGPAEDAPLTTVARIVKYAKDGTFITAWGTVGSAPGELLTPSGLAIDSQGRVFVADPGNARIQIFDQQGRFLDAWPQFGGASGIFIDGNDLLYAADPGLSDSTVGRERGIRIGSVRDGTVMYFISDSGNPRTGKGGVVGVAADGHGNVFGASVDPEIPPRALIKYVR